MELDWEKLTGEISRQCHEEWRFENEGLTLVTGWESAEFFSTATTPKNYLLKSKLKWWNCYQQSLSNLKRRLTADKHLRRESRRQTKRSTT